MSMVLLAGCATTASSRGFGTGVPVFFQMYGRFGVSSSARDASDGGVKTNQRISAAVRWAI
jgi:hypothetical protein